MVQMATTPRQLRAEDLPFIPIDGEHSGYELVAGELVPVMPAGSGHGRLSGQLWSRLSQYEAESKSGMAFLDTWFKLGLARDPEQVRAPDVAFLRNERLKGLSGKLPAVIPFAPDLAVEVFSPENKRKTHDFDQRIRDFLDAGIPLVWIIYPDAGYAMIYHPDGSARLLRETEWLDGEDVLPGFRVALQELFATTEYPPG